MKPVKLTLQQMQAAVDRAQADANREAMEKVFQKRIAKMVADAKKAGYVFSWYTEGNFRLWEK